MAFKNVRKSQNLFFLVSILPQNEQIFCLISPLWSKMGQINIKVKHQGYRNRYNLIDRPNGSSNFCEQTKVFYFIFAHLKDLYKFTKLFLEFEQWPGAAHSTVVAVIFYGLNHWEYTCFYNLALNSP